MAGNETCPNCHAELPVNAPKGLCPACLLEQALESTPGESMSACSPSPTVDFVEERHDMPGGIQSPDDDKTTSLPPVDALHQPTAGTDPRSLDAVKVLRIGPYILVREIGTGGMGSVWLAEQTEPVRRTVALKVIKQGMDSAPILARFEAERQALAMMDHPNIARVFDAGTTPQGQPYFVMEPVDGVPITDYCTKHRLTPSERLDLFVPVCQAIQHAHQKGVIHRDIKPSNVLVTAFDGRPVPKVIDFGLAKAIGQPLTEQTFFTGIGNVVGTLPYMSPEQAGSSPDIDTRSDVYALGVLLYELLTGTTPLTRDRLGEAALGEMLRRIREEEPPRPSLRLAESKDSLATISSDCRTDPARLMKLVRRDLDWVVMKALEKDRSRRYETPSGLAADVVRYLADEPVWARPPSRAYRLRKFVRRHRTAVIVAGVILTGLVALASVSTWFTFEIRDMLSLANRRSAPLYYERGQTAFDNDQIAIGLLMMLESWRAAAAGGDRVWQHAARANLSAWRRQLPRAKGVYLLGGEPIQRVAFSHDGATVLAKSQSGLHVMEVSTGKPYHGAFQDANPFIEGSIPEQFARPELHSAPPGQILTIDRGHPEGILPRVQVRSGNAIFGTTSDWPRVAQLWDAYNRRAISAPMDHFRAITCWTFGPDRKMLLTGAEDGNARLWDATAGRLIGKPMAHPRSLVSVAFSPDAKALVTVCADDQVRIWDAATDSPIGAPMAHPRPVLAVAFSPDSKTLLTGAADGVARRWDAATGTPLGIPMFHPGPIDSLAFHPDGKAVLIGGRDGTVRLWELGTGGDVEHPLGEGPSRPRVVFSTDGKTFFDGKWLRQVATGRPILTALASGSQMRALALSPDGKTLFTGSDEGGNLWDGTTGTRIGAPLVTQEIITSAAFAPDGRTLVVACAPSILRWFDGATGRILGEPFRSDREVDHVIFGPDARFFLTTKGGVGDFFRLDGKSFTFDSGHHLLRIWDAVTRKPVADLMTPVGNARPIRDAVTGQPIRDLITRAGNHFAVNILALAFRPDGRVLLTGSADGSAYFWDVATAQPRGESLAHQGGVLAVAFSPDGKRVLTGCEDGAARLWDAATGKLLGAPLTHRGPVRALAFGPDGKTILTGGDDNSVRLWDALTFKPLGLPLVQRARVGQLAFDADGKTFRALIEDGAPPVHYRHFYLRLWNVAELPDDFPRVEDWVHVLTNMNVDSRGAVRVIDPDSWAKLRHRLGNQASLDLAGMNDELAPLSEAMMSFDPTANLMSIAKRRRSEGKTAEEVAALREQVRLSPGDHVAQTALARALRQLGRLDEALVHCREALRLEPYSQQAHQVHGWILLGKEDWDGAIAEYQVASGTAQGGALFHELGLAFLGKGRLDDAIEQFRIAEKKDRYEPARESLSAALRDADRLSELVSEFRAAIRNNPDDAMVHVHYCRALVWAGRLDEAIAASREAVRIMPDFGPAWQVQGWCLFHDRDWDNAISAYGEAIRRGPDNAAAHNELAIALRGRGRLDEALIEFQRALDLGPGAPDVHRELAATRRQQVLAPRLPAVLRGADRPARAADWLDFAYVCDNRKLHAAAARMFAEAFKADPALANDREGLNRYRAACAAALAARGKGEDVPAPDQGARLSLLSLALGWLEEERAAWESRLPGGSASDRARIVRTLVQWKYDPDLAGLRAAALVKTLPASHQNACVVFWAKIDGMLGRAAGKNP